MSLYDWDEDKAAANLEQHGVAFETVHGFDWATAIQSEDRRRDHGETRMIALGKIGNRDHVLIYTLRAGTIRVISLRNANAREAR